MINQLLSESYSQYQRKGRQLGLLLLLAGLMLSISSCDVSDFGDKNTDPINVTEISPEMLFTRAQMQTTLDENQEIRIHRMAGNIVQQVSTFGDTHFGGMWGVHGIGQLGYYAGLSIGSTAGAYPNRIKTIEETLQQLRIKKEEGENVDNLLAATRIFRVLIYQQVTDAYGDIPYFEAGKGYHEGIYNPSYDSQEEIYNDMFKELDEAVAQFDPSQQTFGSADVMFGGDIAKWQKFGNSLRLRLALRLVNVNSSKAQSEAASALSGTGGVMTGNDDIAYIRNMDRLGLTCCDLYGNRFYYIGVETSGFTLSGTLIEWLRDHNDPRLSAYATLWTGGNWSTGEVISNDPEDLIGRASGWDDLEMESEPHPYWEKAEEIAQRHDIRDQQGDLYVNIVFARMNPAMMTLDGPTIFLSYAQVELMRAEVAARGWSDENAAEYYNNGVRAAFEQLSLYDTGNLPPLDNVEMLEGSTIIPSEEIDAYLAEPSVAFPTGGPLSDQLRQINEQYWAASILDFMEVWANVRRSGYPVLERLKVDSDELPTNHQYVETPRRDLILEDPTNQANLDEARANQGLSGDPPSDIIIPVWWDAD